MRRQPPPLPRSSAFSPTLGGTPLASWGMRYLEGKWLLPNSIWPYPLKSRSCVTSLQSVKAVHRSQSLPFTREASAKRKSEAPLEGSPSRYCPFGLAPAPPTPRRPRPLRAGPAHLAPEAPWFTALGPPALLGKTWPRSHRLRRALHRCPTAATGQRVSGRGWENRSYIQVSCPPPLGKMSF